MPVDPYFCGICEQSFHTEQARYEHDISDEHHKNYESSQRALKRKLNHFCSICNIGGMTSYRTWLAHTGGKRHQTCLEAFHKFYASGSHPGTKFSPSEAGVCDPPRNEKGSSRKPGILNNKTPRKAISTSVKPAVTSDQKASIHIGSTDERSVDPIPEDGNGRDGLMHNILESVSLDTAASAQVSRPLPTQQVPSTKRVPVKPTRLNRANKRSSTQNTPEGAKRQKIDSVLQVPPITSLSNSAVCEASPPINSSDTSDLKRMQEALEISQNLEDLNRIQAALKSHLAEVLAKLEEVKSQKRTLKLQRTALLKGLTGSDSDEEQPSVQSGPPSTPGKTDRLGSEKRITSVLPVNMSSNPKDASLSNPKIVKPPVTLSQGSAFPSAPSTISSVTPPGSTASGERFDLDRLALIRQALRSPDSWQFTFEDVDRMLQHTAATRAMATEAPPPHSDRTVSSTSNQTTSINKLSSPPTQEVNEPILIKPDPENLPANASSTCSSTEPIPTISQASSINPAPSSTSEQHTKPLPLTSKAHHPHQMSSSVDPPPSGSHKDRHHSRHNIHYGEFHAFGGGTAAVTSIVFHHPSSTVLVGGQNGVISQYSLQDHRYLKAFPACDASVTQMVLDSDDRFLFVGYYDNRLAQYDVKSGTTVVVKNFSNRVQALCSTHNIPFIFLAMSSGDILRHHVPDSKSSLLYQCPTAHGITSMALVKSGLRLFLIVGDSECQLTIRDACDGSLIRSIEFSHHKAPPQGISPLPSGMFCSFSERFLRIHNWKTGVCALDVPAYKITSLCSMTWWIATGDSEGSIRIHKLQSDGLPAMRPMKIYYATPHAAITSLISCENALIAGSLDGTVTVLWLTESTSNYKCLYGPFGQNCGTVFSTRKELISHVIKLHLIFGSHKSIMCRWGAGRCRTRFTDTQTIKAIEDHLTMHLPD